MYCHWTSNYEEGRVGIQLTGLTLPLFCAFPKPGPGFQCHALYAMVFLFVCSMQEVIFHFVNIGEIFTITLFS